ncbi:hypothetical protein ACFL4T_07555 [candidate division KSB1 bacterium]
MKKAASIFIISILLVCIISLISFSQEKSDKLIGEWAGIVQDTGALEQSSITIVIKKENGIYKGEASISGGVVTFNKLTVNGIDIKIEFSTETPDGTMKGVSNVKLEKETMKGTYEWEYGVTGIIEIKKVKETDIAGTWVGDAYLNGQDAPNTMTIVIKRKDGVYSGTMTDSFGYVNGVELKNIKLDNDKLTFTYDAAGPEGTIVMENSMTVKKDEMKGTFKTTDGMYSGTYNLKKK